MLRRPVLPRPEPGPVQQHQPGPVDQRHLLVEEHRAQPEREQVAAGRQAYVVCPLVEESEALQARAATAEYERLRAGELRDYRVALLHGLGDALFYRHGQNSWSPCGWRRLSEPVANCMAARMVNDLSIVQLRRIGSLEPRPPAWPRRRTGTVSRPHWRSDEGQSGVATGRAGRTPVPHAGSRSQRARELTPGRRRLAIMARWRPCGAARREPPK